MGTVEAAREFALMIRRRLGEHYLKAYLLYLRLLAVLFEVGEVRLPDLMTMMEEYLRDQALLNQLLRDLSRLGLVSQREGTIRLNYGRYLELRRNMLKEVPDTTRLQLLGPILALYREYVMRRGLSERVMRSPRSDTVSK